MIKLKPCPFCGTPDPKLTKSPTQDERSGYNFYVEIRCKSCASLVTRESAQDPSGWCSDKGEAMQETIETWSTRA